MSTKALFLLGLGASFAFLVALGAMAMGDAKTLVATQRDVRRTHEVIGLCQETLTRVYEATTELTSVVLSENQDDLDRYETARKGIDAGVRGLVEATREETDLAGRVEGLDRHIQAQFGDLDRLVEQRRAVGPGSGQAARVQAFKAAASIRLRVEDLETAARSLLLERSERADRSARQTLRASGILLVGAAAFNLILFVLLLHHMTGLRRARDAAASLNRDLGERQGALERANRELDAFTYSVSHDLRAPLRTIDGYSRILLDEHGEHLDAEGRRVVGVLRSEARRMGSLFDGLLALSRAERHELQAEEVDLGEVVRAAAEAARGGEPGRAVALSIDALPTVRGDAVLLRQAFFNLLSNAYKYTRGREKAEVRVTSRREGATHVITVADNGIGFAPADAERLFGVFRRLTRDERFEGIGVGLAIVERIVRRHGGSVRAEGEEGRGAAFHVTLPA